MKIFSIWILTICFCTLLYSCTNTDASKKELIRKVATATSNGLAKKVIGTWNFIGDENASLVIESDSIYYPEKFRSFKYRVTNDVMHIKYDDYVSAFLIEMKGADTLVLKGNEVQTYVRVNVK